MMICGPKMMDFAPELVRVGFALIIMVGLLQIGVHSDVEVTASRWGTVVSLITEGMLISY